MEASSVTRRDAEYRRGAILGLTVAEVFILLLFMLLLLFIVLTNDLKKRGEAVAAKLVESQERLVRAEVRLEEWQGVMTEFKAPEEIVTLRREKAKLEQTAEQHRQETQVLREVIEQMDQTDQRSAQFVEQILEAQQQVKDIKEELRVLREKGHNPPCWYRRVPGGEHGTREQPYYTFNIAVFDDNMIVQRAETPPGGATDDGDSNYATEAVELGLDNIPYCKPLDDAAIIKNLQRISQAGRDARVRSYSCIFWVRVWDKTSTSAKERWKSAHDGVLEGLFGAYTVKNDPWPEPSTDCSNPDSIPAVQFAACRAAAENGDVDMQDTINVEYAKGQNIPQDYREAMAWFRRAAERGDADAQYNLGLLYHQGQGVPRDFGVAMAWFRRAAEQGHAGAQYRLGLSYSLGGGVPQDDAEAATWFRRAAEQGHAGAQYRLGLSHCLGNGVPQNYTLAHMWATLAGKDDHEDAVELRDEIARNMTPAQIVEAQRLAREWIEAHQAGVEL